MHIVFVRHGEKRRGESDPELTSWGRRMSTETARWIQRQGLTPTLLWHTPTARTRQTAEEIRLVFSAPAAHQEAGLPELIEDWERLVETLEAQQSADAVVVLVGHHPTMDMLVRELGPPPVAVPRGNFASAVVLQPGASGWQCTASWPGRAS